MEEATPPPELRAPGLQGLLARTLSSSPCTRWILPARIRSPSKNDIVFVGNSSVNLREFIVGDGPYLAEASCSITFDAQILAADIISATTETVSSDELIINQSVEEVRFTTNGRLVKEDEPAQILVLSTSKSELIFLYARDNLDGTVRFVHGTKPIFSGIGYHDPKGLHLAHDPDSRALAVAPNPDLCVICSLHPLEQIKDEVNQWRPATSHLKPFREQRFVQVDGNIVRMDFLTPPKDDKDKIILVLIVAKQSRAYMVLYRWDATQPLHRIKPMRSSGQQLPEEDKMPLMLIPCNAPASFLLVTETELVLYNRVTHSEAKRTAHDLSDRHEFREGRRTKMWTQWAKPRRTEVFRKSNDEIMLVREDGALRSYDIDVQSDLQVKIHWSPGSLNISMDTAFCTLPAPLAINGGDIVIAGGSITEGGVFHLENRTQPRLLQPIFNGTPFNDLLLLPPNTSREIHVDRRSRIFTCCGSQQGGGGLAEIQHGIEAEIGWTMDHPDVASILRMWTLEGKITEQLLLLSTHPFHSSLITLDILTSELEVATSDQLPGINLEVATLAAAVIGNDILVQVTTSDMNVVSIGTHFPPIRHSLAPASPLCADIDSATGTVVVAHSQGEGFAVSLCSVTISRTPSIQTNGRTELLHTRPSSICISTIDGALVAVIGTDRADLEMLILGPEEKNPLRVPSLVPELGYTSIGSLCLLSTPDASFGLLLCGLRNGHLLCVQIRREEQRGDSYSFTLISKLRLARTSINVSPDECTRQGRHISAAFIVHGTVLERISLKANNAGVEYEQCRVIIHNRNMPPTAPESIHAVSRIPQLGSGRGQNISGLLMCATPTDVSFSYLVGHSKAVARHIPVAGLAHKVIYSNFLKAMIVGVNPMRVASSESETNPPMLCFAMLSDDEADCNPIDESKTVMLGEADERISALTHYSPTDERHHFEMILVALQSSTKVGPGKARINSRIVCVSDKHILKGSATPRVVMRLPGKRVTALCPIGKSGLLIGSNNELLLHNLNVGSKKWSALTRHALPSPARQIRVQGSLIYVATEKHSLLILKENESTLSIQTSDTRARSVSNVLPIHRHHIIIADNTTTGTQLSGILEDQRGSTLQRSFEFQVPHLLDRLEQDRADQNRNAFVANALDGTLYSFCTLTMDEWILCHFLEGLTKPGMKIGAKTIGQELDVGLWTKSGRLKFSPSLMGVNGDLIARMLEPGAYYLRTLLEPSIKLERAGEVEMSSTREDELGARMSALSRLLGRVTDQINDQDVIGSAIIWLRGLLRS